MTQNTTAEYTQAEVAMRNGKDKPEIWIIINRNVYDVTNYVDSHPGGAEILLEWAGKDATDEFEAVGHSSDALKVVKSHKIGELVKGSKVSEPISAVTNGESKKKRKFFIFC